jgi:hypothetical protein
MAVPVVPDALLKATELKEWWQRIIILQSQASLLIMGLEADVPRVSLNATLNDSVVSY